MPMVIVMITVRKPDKNTVTLKALRVLKKSVGNSLAWRG